MIHSIITIVDVDLENSEILGDKFTDVVPPINAT
jgi:hypothetical protein